MCGAQEGRLEFKDRCSVGQALARSGWPVFPDDSLPPAPTGLPVAITAPRKQK